MIISRTPFRISFFGGGTFGGGTDYPGWYRRHGGAVLATTIDKYCYLTCRYLPPFFEHRFRVVYSKTENCQTVGEISHPSVRETLRFMGITRGLEIHHDADLPARGGMGSSSAFTVGLLHALYALKGTMPGKKRLATESIRIEQDLLRETVGSQDQVCAAYGGLNHITFFPNGDFSVHPVTLRKQRLEELNDHLMLFYTGIKRTASDIAQTYVEILDGRRRQLRIMRDLVEESVELLHNDGDLTDFGKLLDEAWRTKASLSSSVTNSEIDGIYQTAVRAGAVGGKLMGAGGGGFMVFFVPPERQNRVREALRGLLHVPFRFEFFGSQIIFCDPEQEYPEEEEERGRNELKRFRELTGRKPEWM